MFQTWDFEILEQEKLSMFVQHRRFFFFFFLNIEVDQAIYV